jgi:hypothetical protein
LQRDSSGIVQSLYGETTKRRHITAIVILSVGVVAAWLLWPRPTVQGVLNDFFRDEAGRAEDMLMDPLILHADLVKHRIIDEVKSPTMVKRRHAIGFLGVAHIAEALPVLRTILADEDEKDYFRADALESIYRISKQVGLSLAGQHKSREDFLGDTAMRLIDGSHQPIERSYAQASVGHHE